MELKLGFSEPLRPSDIAKGLNAIENSFNLFINESPPTEGNIEIRVSECRKGSIVWDLISLSPTALPVLIDYGPYILDYGKLLVEFCQYKIGKKPELPAVKNQNIFNQMSGVATPVAGDVNGTMTVTNYNGSTVINHNHYTHNEVNLIVIPIGEEPPTHKLFSNVVLKLSQVRDDVSTNRGFRGLIENIDPHTVKVEFTDTALARASAVILDERNPLRKTVRVNVMVEYRGERPAVYRVTDIL